MIFLSKRHLSRILFYGIFILATLSAFYLLPSAALADVNDRLGECAKIEESAARLECFDELSGRTKTAPVAARAASDSTPSIPDASSKPGKLSVLEKHWDLDVNQRKHSFILRPYRLNYFLPVAYNSSPNEETALEYDPQAKALHNEAKLQLSFKAKVFEDLLQKPLQPLYDKVKVIQGVDIWAAYTQMSFWQLYNSAFSAPFRDTNYEPELLINFRSSYTIPGLRGTKLQYFNIAFNHQSNGRSKPLSRSWNRIIGNVGLEKGNFNLQLKTWYRLPEDEMNDDNPDLIRFMGYGELWATYFREKQRFAVMLRNNLRQNNLGAVQLDWSIPPITLGRLLLGSFVADATLNKYLTDKFSLYVQYFNGYGEGMMDYNKSINRISVGLMLAEWN